MDIAFFGKPVPLAGQRKPASKSTITRLLQPHMDRESDGHYLYTVTMENRCCNSIEVGPRLVYVTDDHGNSVLVADRGRAWN